MLELLFNIHSLMQILCVDTAESVPPWICILYRSSLHTSVTVFQCLGLCACSFKGRYSLSLKKQQSSYLTIKPCTLYIAWLHCLYLLLKWEPPFSQYGWKVVFNLCVILHLQLPDIALAVPWHLYWLIWSDIALMGLIQIPISKGLVCKTELWRTGNGFKGAQTHQDPQAIL